MPSSIRCLVGSVAVAAAGIWASPARAEIIFGMTATGSGSTLPGVNLVSFDSATPGTINTIGPFTGLVATHTLRSIDFRPATGQLWGISVGATGTAAQLYTINLTNAALTPVGPGFNLGTNTSQRIEMDFNPVADRIRIISGSTGASGQNTNFRADPNTGLLVTANDTNLVFDAADVQATNTGFSITAAAYSNNFAGAATTTLYGWEFSNDSLLTIGGLNGTPSPNLGQMFTVATSAAFLTFNGGMGMDISGATNTLFVTHDDPATGTTMSLFTRSLTSPAAETLVGAYPAGTFITDISVQPIPEPTTLALTGLAAIGFVARFRRKKVAAA